MTLPPAKSAASPVTSPASSFNLGWYPNSRHVFAICNTGNWGSRPTFRFDTATGEMKPLPNVVGMSAYFNPAILADGKTLVYTGREQDQETGLLQALDTETGSLRALFRASVSYTGIGSLDISPDRKKIVYVQFKRGTDGFVLMLSDLDNPQPRIIYECQSGDCAGTAPFFTPGQRSIVFWRGNKELWESPVDGGPAKLLRKLEWTSDGPAFHPTSGEIIVGVGTHTSQLRVLPARAK